MKQLYNELAALVNKAQSPEDYEAAVQAILDDHDGKLTQKLLAILEDARQTFLDNFDPSDETDERELEDLIREAVNASFPASYTETLVAALAPVVSATLKQTLTTYSLGTSFEQANTAALAYLQSTNENFFTTLADETVKGILANIAEAKSEQHTLPDIIRNVRASYGKDLTFVTGTGTRTLDNRTWATLTARTEGTRAAAAGTRSLLRAVGARSWQWLAESQACDECVPNDGEVVAMGDDFPSGDDQPPAHPNCRCIVIPVVAELTSPQGQENEDEQDTAA